MQEYIDAQQDIKKMITESYKKDRLAHAYIFSGSKGSGAYEMALYLACLHYCKNGGCLECDDCRRILEHKNINVYEVNPTKDNIGVADIEKLQDEFFKSSLENGKRFYIINEAECMNVAASNKILKFIEEPPTDSIGILVVSDYTRLLPTIISRCNIITFKSISKDIIFKSLVDDGIDSKYASLLSLNTSNIDNAKALYKDDVYKKIMDDVIMLIKLKNVRSKIIYFTNLESYIYENDNFKQYLETVVSLMLKIYKNENVSGLENECREYQEQKNGKKIEANINLALKILKMLDARVSVKNAYALFISNLN